MADTQNIDDDVPQEHEQDQGQEDDFTTPVKKKKENGMFF